MEGLHTTGGMQIRTAKIRAEKTMEAGQKY
jgi:hypothetical protein